MSFNDFILFVFSDLGASFTVIITLAVAFVNGWTDAPNAIASCVASRSLSLRNAVILASVADFAGSMTMGLVSGKVTQTVMSIANFGSDSRMALISLCAAMTSVVIWAVSAWIFGIPTSESHALIAGLSGASIAVNRGFSGISISEWNKVLFGLLVSAVPGFVIGYIVSKLTVCFSKKFEKQKTDAFFRHSQILSSLFMAFMHGAQDSQKFAGILMLAVSLSGESSIVTVPYWLVFICSAVIALGTATGGGRIIKSVGIDMIKLRKDQGFASDMAGALCLLVSTLSGFPVSTTHTKTSAIMGVGVARSIKSVDWSIAGEVTAAWILTFPGCAVLSYLITLLFFKIF